jgi:M6 family metalloprotease domain
MMTTALKRLGAANESVAPKEMASSSGGVEKVLVIPIEFSDKQFISPDSIQFKLQNIMTSKNNSVKDYYEKNSSYIQGQRGMSIDADVSPVVTSPKTMKYYGSDITGIDENTNNDTYVFELAYDALVLLKQAHPDIDYSEYDKNNDGEIDHLMIVHAGNGQEDSDNANDIWSHRWSIPFTDGSFQPYACVPETGTLGVYVHEFGHDIGLPDLYDNNYVTNGVGEWDVMGSGSWNRFPGQAAGTCPANLSAWSKAYLRWMVPQDITTDSINKNITNNNGNSLVLCIWPYGNKSSNE